MVCPDHKINLEFIQVRLSYTSDVINCIFNRIYIFLLNLDENFYIFDCLYVYVYEINLIYVLKYVVN